jgi:hypothetical protein
VDPIVYLPGLHVSTYLNHYYGGDTNWFTNTYYTPTSSIIPNLNQTWWGSTTVSNEYTGYFYAPTAGTYTFTFITSNESYLWVGPTALSGYNNTNALINTGGNNSLVSISRTIVLDGDTHYPMRVQWGANGISSNFIANFHSPVISSDAVQNLDSYLSHVSPTLGF